MRWNTAKYLATVAQFEGHKEMMFMLPYTYKEIINNMQSKKGIIIKRLL